MTDQCNANHRPGDLFHRLDGRIPWRQAMLDVMLHCFDHHDGVVHHEADCKNEPKQ